MDEKILNSLLDYAREYMGAEIPFNNKWIIENFLIAERIKLSKQQSNCNLPHVSKCDGIEREALLNSFARFLEGYYSETGIKISDVSIDLFQQTI